MSFVAAPEEGGIHPCIGLCAGVQVARFGRPDGMLKAVRFMLWGAKLIKAKEGTVQLLIPTTRRPTGKRLHPLRTPIRWSHPAAALAITLIGTVLHCPPAAGQIVLLDDDFDVENGGVGVVNYTGFANFSVTAGSVDLIGNGFADFFPGNGLYLDLDGTSNAGGTLASAAFDLQPGIDYTVQFDLGNTDQRFGGGSVDNSVTVTFGSALSETFNRNGLAPFEVITRNFFVPAAETAQLVFEQAGGDNLGVLIDNVRITAVPEPTSLLLVGLGALALRSRRAG